MLLFNCVKNSGNARCSTCWDKMCLWTVLAWMRVKTERAGGIQWDDELEPSGATSARVAPSPSYWPWLLLPKLPDPRKESIFHPLLRPHLKKEREMKGTSKTSQLVVSVRNFFRETLSFFTSPSRPPLSCFNLKHTSPPVYPVSRSSHFLMSSYCIVKKWDREGR